MLFVLIFFSIVLLVWMIYYFFRKLHRKQKGLEHEREEFESLFDNIPAMILYKDLSGNILKANRTFRDLFEHLTKNPVGQKSEDFVPGLRAIVPKIDEQVIKTGRPLDFYFCYEDPLLGLRWVGGVKVPYRDAEDKIIGTVMLGKDITEQKRAEDGLKQAKERAEAANLSKSEFLFRVSHEIKAPLTGLIGMLELLMGTKLSLDQHRYAATIHSSAELLLALMSDVLDLSKIEQGLIRPNFIPVNLEELVSQMAEILEVEAKKKKVELLVFSSTELPRLVFADPVLIKQVLLNLIVNAIKFSGTREVFLSVQKKDSWIRFAIRDTGIGIPQEKHHLLFQKFTQVDPMISHRLGGTGLGLAISKELVQLMGGRIGVESAEAAGSTFWFEIPCHPAPHQLEEPKLREEIKSKRMLVVDDYKENRETLLHYLTFLKCMHADGASTGEEALKKLGQAVKDHDPYSIVFIDFMMPEMNGKQLGRLIKNDPAFKDLKMVLFSGITKLEHIEDLQDLGFTAVLFKPIFVKDLIQVLNQL